MHTVYREPKPINPTYFHGTDLRIMEMKDVERNQFKSDISDILEYIWGVLKQMSGDKAPFYFFFSSPLNNSHKELMQRTLNCITMYSAYKNGCHNYQYQSDCIYLSNAAWKVKGYAYRAFAFGEFGLIAYRFIQFMEEIRPTEFAPTAEIQAKIDKLKSFAEQEPKPIVFVYSNLDPEFIFSTEGVKFSRDSICCFEDIIYTKHLSFDDFDRMNSFELKPL